MDTNEIAIKIGDYLRKIRLHKNIKLRKFADMIGYSHGHISSIENGKKGLPTHEFLDKYLEKLSDSYEEYNFHINKIAKLSNNQIKLEPIQIIDVERDSKSLRKGYLTDSEKKFINNLNLIAEPFELSYLENNEKKTLYLSIPANDLSFHLKDTNNNKFYKRILLSEMDRKNIENILDNYFENKINIQKETRSSFEHSEKEEKEFEDKNKDIMNKLDDY
ncbi:helix-turn-helix domain-containing protein [Staphylococcus epidermidis]|uniref:helix-turn-helix domain-containing protein n=1 Tax=Staphylococcus epidermidis TaxID=1282 RepID=UPI001F070A72|nr:helix-turn-helix transcriptional regulator [Staphylococcus epidermidis]MCH1589990.1 helix-turn-helix domain-containing protein [Staphylococcus epidermidis]